MEDVIMSVGSIAEDGENGVYFYLNGWEGEEEDIYLREVLMTSATARAVALLLVAAADRFDKKIAEYDAVSEGRIGVRRNDMMSQRESVDGTIMIRHKRP